MSALEALKERMAVISGLQSAPDPAMYMGEVTNARSGTQPPRLRPNASRPVDPAKNAAPAASGGSHAKGTATRSAGKG